MKRAAASPRPQALFDKALAHHQAGRFAEAQGLYREVLGLDPRHADSLHLLGVIALQTGDCDGAIAFIGQALQLNDAAALYHSNLGNALKAKERFDEAVASYNRALALNPAYAEAHVNIAEALRKQEKFEESESHGRKAVALRPDLPEAHLNLGNALRGQERFDEAAACYHQALALRPSYAEAFLNLGITLKALGRTEEAFSYCQKAVELNGTLYEAHNNLGNIHKESGRLDEALGCYNRALALHPNYVEAHNNLGNVYKELEQYDKALACYARALERRPDYATTHVNRGNAFHAMKRLDEAQEEYARALALQPTFAEAHWNDALLRLRRGDYKLGWRKYEWRRRAYRQANLSMPLWDGRPLDGKTILLHHEQGLGDSLQFIRYAPLVKAQGGHVWVVCPSPLVRLFQSVEGIDRVFSFDMPMEPYDCYAPLLSLPGLFGTTLENLPAKIPYLHPDPALVALWRDRLEGFSGLKVGLVWAGNPRKDDPNCYAVDRRRSMRLEHFAPLANLPGVRLISLQMGESAEEIKTPPAGMQILDPMEHVTDYADTAALIANLDLVIGVDTSVVHAAGALGKPTWVLSRFDGCWRWLEDRDDSPWYPSLRLFRQESAGNWEDVIEKVSVALRAFNPGKT